MAEQAPSALLWLGSRVTPDLGGVLSGIVGDEEHDRGYHRGRKYVPTYDYSIQLSEDKQGSGDFASAIDMSFNTTRMKLYTSRLKAAAERNDPRLKYVREFYGTLDGKTVFGLTHKGSSDSTWERATSDKSHLWHIHKSILRKYANDRAVMQGILDVMLGKPLPKPGDDDMTKDEAKQAVREVLHEIMPYQAGGPRDRLKAAGWGDISIRMAVDYMFETLSHNSRRFDEVQAAVAGVDEEVMNKIRDLDSPEAIADVLRNLLGDKADAVFRAGLGQTNSTV